MDRKRETKMHQSARPTLHLPSRGRWATHRAAVHHMGREVARPLRVRLIPWSRSQWRELMPSHFRKQHPARRRNQLLGRTLLTELQRCNMAMRTTRAQRRGLLSRQRRQNIVPREDLSSQHHERNSARGYPAQVKSRQSADTRTKSTNVRWRSYIRTRASAYWSERTVSNTASFIAANSKTGTQHVAKPQDSSDAQYLALSFSRITIWESTIVDARAPMQNRSR